MSYNVINSFKFGLDTRRSELTSVPGTLEELRNAHVNQGGEVEKRKAFVRTELPLNDTFGMEAVNDKIVLFGSSADFGGWPPNVIYQRLVPPLAGNGQMTEVLYSTVYAGKTFVIAKYQSGRTYMFYDAVLIPDCFNGVVDNFNNPSDLAALLAGIINDTGIYTAVQQAFPNDFKVNTFGSPGLIYTLVDTLVSALGTAGIQLISTGTPAINAVAAFGSFQIFGGSEVAGHQITQVAVGATNLLTAVVPYNDNNVQTATDVSTAINANTLVSGYNATASGNVVSIFANTAGTTPNGQAVVVTSAGDVIIGQCSFSMAGTSFTIDYINADGVNLLSASQVYSGGTSIATFVASLATNINARTGTTGYLAFAQGAVLFLSKTVTSSADAAIKVDVSLTGDGTLFTGTVAPMFVTAPTTFMPISRTFGNGFWVYTSLSSITVQPVGGTPPYTYQWSMLSGTRSIAPVDPSSATLDFNFVLPTQVVFSDIFVCTIMDALGNSATSPQISVFTGAT